MSFVQELFFKEKTPGRELLDSIAGGCQEIYASGVKAGAASFFASHVFDRLERHCVLVAASYDEAQEYYDELQFFRSMQQAPGDDAPDVLLFPPLETQPYENVLSHCDISSQRLWTLYRLCDTARPALVVTTVQALLQRLLPGSVLIDSCRTVTCGDEIDRDRLCEDLVACGYARVSMVEDRGDVSVRGEVLDLFPPGLDRPVRIDFFGDIVESIRLFDPATQRSCADLRAVELVPVREIILRDDVVQSCETRAAQASRAGLFATAKGRSFLDNIKNGFLPSGVEFALDVIYDEPETFFDYLPGEALFFWCDRKQTEAIVDSFVAEITRHYASASEERRVVSAPQDLYVGLDGFDGLPVPHQQIFFESFAVERRDTRLIKFNSRANDDIRQEMIACASQSGALGTLVERLEQWQENGIRTCIVCHTPSQCRRLAEMLQEYGLETSAAHERSFNEAVSMAGDGRIELLIGQLSRGFRYEDGLLVLITEEEIFGEKKRRRAAPRMKVGTAISDFSDLKEGDYVVHRDNGIGVYLGLETLDAG
ncbi:MAG: hypothetical protein GY868_19175, partial [Deltaproteobacteria bacterium]|nr:hypothetical protein [Deltaproteobacteria bacterium]